MARKFFQIGFNKCGTTFIARLFGMNGYPAVHWAEGALAEDIAWSKLTGVKPLRPWADTVAFTAGAMGGQRHGLHRHGIGPLLEHAHRRGIQGVPFP